MPDPQIGQGYNSDIAYRYKPGQSAAEFYSQKSGQTFGGADQLAGYVNSNYQGVNANAQNVFDVLAQGYTPRAQALDSMKNDINNFQQNAFNTPDPSSKRAASSITDSITGEQTNYDTLTQQYKDLSSKLLALQAPNYQQGYNDLRTQQGVPGYEQDYLKSQQNIRELPYTNRMSFGNAGAATEGQLSADTQQKGIPLEIQQANILDRLKLANDFINNSMNFKQLDYNSSRQSLSDAIKTASDAIGLSHTHLNDLLTQRQQDQARQDLANSFAFENRISSPFYDIGGTVYRTSDRMPAHNQAEYVAMGGKGDFSDVQKVDANSIKERDSVSQLAQKYPDAGINLTDNLATASKKLQNSASYKAGLTQFGQTGTDLLGNAQYGFINPGQQSITPININGSSGNPGGLTTPAAVNNNPLNITLGPATQKWVDQGLATLNQTPDGRKFLKFNDPQTGLQAAQDLLFSSPVYKNLTVDQALRKWSGGGYGAEIAPFIQGKNIKIGDLNSPDMQPVRDQLVKAMAKREDIKNYNQLFGSTNTDSNYSGVLGRNLNSQEQQVVNNYVDEVKNGTTIAQLKNEVLYRGNQKILPIVLDEVKKQIPGFNINNSDLYQKAQAETVKNLNSQQVQTRRASINNIIHTLDDIVAPLSDKFQRTGITAINDKYLKAAYGVSNEDAVKFSSAMKGVTEELARAFGGAQGVTDAKLDFAGKLLDQNLSPSAFKAQVNTIRYLLNLNLQSTYGYNTTTIPGLPPGYSTVYQGGQTYSPQSPGSQQSPQLDLSKFDH